MGRKKETPNLSGVTIAPMILYAEGLSDGEKIVLGKIDNFHAGPKGCYASLDYLAIAVGMDRRRFVRVIKRLKDKNLIQSWTDPEKPLYTYRKVIRENLPPVSAEFLSANNPPTSVNLPLVENAQPVSNRARNQCQIVRATSVKSCAQPVSNRASASGCIRNNINNTNTNEFKKSKSKTVGVDFKSKNQLGLGLEISKKKLEFAEATEKLWRLNEKEVNTFGQIGRHLAGLVERGIKPITIFDDAIAWAKKARTSRAYNQRGLFVAKVKDETGFEGTGLLLKKQAAHAAAVRAAR